MSLIAIVTGIATPRAMLTDTAKVGHVIPLHCSSSGTPGTSAARCVNPRLTDSGVVILLSRRVSPRKSYRVTVHKKVDSIPHPTELVYFASSGTRKMVHANDEIDDKELWQR